MWCHPVVWHNQAALPLLSQRFMVLRVGSALEKGMRMLVVCWTTKPHIPLPLPIPLSQLAEGLQHNPVPFSQHIPLLPDPTQYQGTAAPLLFPCPHSALRGTEELRRLVPIWDNQSWFRIVCFHSITGDCVWKVLLDVVCSNLPALAGPPRASFLKAVWT